MNLAEQISMMHDDLGALGHGDPALEAPAAVTDGCTRFSSRDPTS
jgi:hypothetical protein